eukprot:TRINITY_DN107832_c0_g1_i1.p1 TRINITY_DN107832_c0_g1~~TRINITY_DN107832_c0_g1_i1.p1  ORF type:complete len:518 (+),score=87.47 TRINITY_DN107832_c0_g1_i1:35-1555(+)
MVSYGCRHIAGTQFVFEEQPRWIVLGLCAVVVIGMLIGLLIGVIISFGGLYVFELSVACIAIFVAYDAYDLTFTKKWGAHDTKGFIYGVIMTTLLVSILMGAMRYAASVLNTRQSFLFFGLGGVVLGLFAYTYHALCCQEDQRKHHLGPCSPGGESYEDPPREDQEEMDELHAAQKFLNWILSGQWWFDINDWSIPADDECSAKDQVVVHNRTLKLIKVCVYSANDLVCWVPVGGISGSCVGFIRAGEVRAFTLPRSSGTERNADSFKLKVFMPGVLDKELAAYARAQRGQCFAFSDVEGMVRRSRFLSASPAPSERELMRASSSLTESSEDEAACQAAQAALMKDSKVASLRPDTPSEDASSTNPSFGTSLMKRNGSSADLMSSEGGLSRRGSFQKAGQVSDGNAGSPVRKAASCEIVIRNRSNSEIRALLFRPDDYCCMLPVMGKLMACGDVILPFGERRFRPPDSDVKEFTVKVYSVGAGAKELTYLSVSRGNTYTFCDSLLS